MIRVECPGCGKGIKAPEKYYGKRVNCPACKAPIDIPVPEAPAVVEPKPAPPVTPPPPPAPAPPVVEAAPRPAPVAHATIEHSHKVKNSSFLSGFGLMMGCLTAVVVLGIGGCVAFVLIGGAAVGTAGQAVSEAMEEANKQMEEERAARRAKEEAREAAIALKAEKVVVLEAEVVPPGEFAYQNSIRIKVRNDSDVPLSRLFFHGVLQSPGRSVPWAEDDFNYKVSGGLEVGETQEWNLSATLSSFSSVDFDDAAEFQVTVRKVEWPGMEAELGDEN